MRSLKKPGAWLLVLFSFLPGHATAEEKRGIRLVPSVILASAMSAVALTTVLIPKPRRARSAGPTLLDRPFQDALEQPTQELRKKYLMISDVSLWMNIVPSLAAYGIVAWASPRHQSPAQANRFFIAGQALLSNVAVIFIVKNLVARERPIGINGRGSFPCGHCAATFAPAFLIFSDASPLAGDDLKAWRFGLGSAALTLATITSVFRMSAGQHYFTDVIAGVGLGFAFGYVYPWLIGNGEPEAQNFHVAPAFHLTGDGAYMTLQIPF